MNRQRFVLDDLSVEPELLKDILRCLLHSIIFQRAFGLVRPTEGNVDLLDFIYARTDDPEIESTVESQIESINQAIKKKGLRKFQVLMTWFEKRKDKAGWFSGGEKKVPWEDWVFTIVLTPNKEATISEQRKGILEEDLRNRLVMILKIVNENKNHIPPLVSKEVMPFQYEIQVPTAAETGTGGLDMIWSMIKAPNPTLN